jgi:hypothetical protein
MNEILPKLHDILKLTGESKNHRRPEWMEGFPDVDPELKKSLKHHCVSGYWNKKQHRDLCFPFPLEKETLCIHLADIKAATISRKLRTFKHGLHYRTFRIWKDGKKSPEVLQQEKNTFKAFPNIPDDLKSAVDLNGLYARLMPEFENRSEDARSCPFASLDTHNELTGLWTSFFLQNQAYFGIPDRMEDPRDYRRTIYFAMKRQVAVVRVRLTTHGKLSRLRDTKLLKDIRPIMEHMAAALKGVVIYTLPEELLLITVPSETEAIKKRAEQVLSVRSNYYFETTVVNSVLANREFLYNYNKVFGPYQDNLYPYLPAEIDVIEGNEASHRAIICDMCQMAPALRVYPREIYPHENGAEPVDEFLCEGCLKVRDEADRARKLATWEEQDECRVAFFKITLDMSRLNTTLKAMFAQEFGFKRVIDDDLGFSIMKEFLKDYGIFLTAFKDTVFKYEEYGLEENHELILENLFCIKIGKKSHVRPLVADYVELFQGEQFFCKMVEFCKANGRPLPVKLSVTISGVKFPFMEHWNALDRPQGDINIYAVPRTKLAVGFYQYSYLRDAMFEDHNISSALHKLAEIEERTDNTFLVTTAMLEVKNDLKGMAVPLIATRDLTIRQVLAYYKIMSD